MRLQTLRDSLTIVPVPHAARVEQASLTQHDLDAAKGSPSAHHAVDGGSSYVVSVQAKEALVQLHGETRETERRGGVGLHGFRSRTGK